MCLYCMSLILEITDISAWNLQTYVSVSDFKCFKQKFGVLHNGQDHWNLTSVRQNWENWQICYDILFLDLCSCYLSSMLIWGLNKDSVIESLVSRQLIAGYMNGRFVWYGNWQFLLLHRTFFKGPNDTIRKPSITKRGKLAEINGALFLIPSLSRCTRERDVGTTGWTNKNRQQ